VAGWKAEKRYAYRILVGKPVKKRQLEEWERDGTIKLRWIEWGRLV
jgi:hypothetical protein